MASTWFLALALLLQVSLQPCLCIHSARQLLAPPESGPSPSDLACTSQGPSQLCPFIDPLPLAATVAAQGAFKMGAYMIKQALHQDLPDTLLFGFGTSPETATFPGPTLEATYGTPADITWENSITSGHPLTVDSTIAPVPTSGVPLVVHLHGGETQSMYDGHPEAWYTNGLAQTGPTYSTNTFHYGNTQDPATLWYHDHVLGYTRLNVQMGLAGFYLLRNPAQEKSLKLPSGGFEVPLAIKDYALNADGSIHYPDTGSGTHPHWVPEFFGDIITANGMAWPFFEVLPRKYRFRILNACNARFLDLSFSNGAVVFVQVGTDGGYLSRPVQRSKILLAPGERADVVIDFKGLKANTEVVLQNDAAAPYPSGAPVSDNGRFGGTSEVLKFIVRQKLAKSQRPKKGILAPGKGRVASDVAADEPNGENDNSNIPGFFQDIPDLQHPPATVERYLTLSETLSVGGQVDAVLLGNLVDNHNVQKHYSDPITETPQDGSTELWHIINLTVDAHPIHFHLIRFRLASRFFFDADAFAAGNCQFVSNGTLKPSCLQGPAPIEDNEQGWKDTVRNNPGQVTTFALRFKSQSGANFPFDPTEGPGYVWHCHILDHEDNDMMRPYKVVR